MAEGNMTRDDLARKLAPPPGWLRKAWADAKSRGLDTTTLAEINAEVLAVRAEQRASRDEGE
jgi:hypothetical protein